MCVGGGGYVCVCESHSFVQNMKFEKMFRKVVPEVDQKVAGKVTRANLKFRFDGKNIACT